MKHIKGYYKQMYSNMKKFLERQKLPQWTQEEMENVISLTSKETKYVIKSTHRTAQTSMASLENSDKHLKKE